jgi:HSP20 family molecular chaperone IbpA
MFELVKYLTKEDPFFTSVYLSTMSKEWFDCPTLIKNEDGSASFCIELPGVTKEQLSLETKEHTIILKATQKKLNKESKIEQNFILPKTYDMETLSAELKDGLLVLNIKPLQHQQKFSKIEIK